MRIRNGGSFTGTRILILFTARRIKFSFFFSCPFVPFQASGVCSHLLNLAQYFGILFISSKLFAFLLMICPKESSHSLLDLPLLLFPFALTSSICLGFPSSSILTMCPNHLNPFLSIIFFLNSLFFEHILFYLSLFSLQFSSNISSLPL